MPLVLGNGWEFLDKLLFRSIVTLTGIALTVWVSMEMLLPWLFFRQRQLVFILAGLGLVAGLTMLVEWNEAPWAYSFFKSKSRGGGNTVMPHNSPWHIMRYIGGAMPYFTAWIGSSLWEIARFAKKKEQEASEFRNEKLEAEMKFLKSQFNPHFLFNALNNIYTLTVLKSDQASDSLLKLSGMLRYMSYDCKADTVPLGKEIAYLRDFVGLHLLKDSRGLNVTLELDERRPDLNIAPMLLIPFVENAFKHSRVEDLQRGWIKIRLQTESDTILFEVQNSRPAESFTKDQIGGIGLENVRRQLELMYGGRHTLDIREAEDTFAVTLKIQAA
jgi:hypothetical protein